MVTKKCPKNCNDLKFIFLKSVIFFKNYQKSRNDLWVSTVPVYGNL